MENKTNYLLKLICLVGIFALITGFIFGFANLNTVTVERVSVEERGEAGESFTRVGRPNKVVTEVIEKAPEENEQLLENAETEELQDEKIESKNTEATSEDVQELAYVEAELNTENCDYVANEEAETINIEEYKGNVDCVIIPEEIDGKKVESVDALSFSECYNLETIKVAKEIADTIGDIPDFEIDENLEEENYIVYKTTREYSEGYLAYISLSEEEKAERYVVPNKFDVPLENVYSEKMQNLYPVGALEPSYDLRDDILVKVENQNPYGTCYAYASLTSIETYWALNKHESIDLSDMHTAILTSGSGGPLLGHNDEFGYFSGKLGPVYEEDYSMNDVKTEVLSNYNSIANCLASDDPTVYSSVQNYAKQKSAEKIALDSVAFSSIGYSKKANSSYAAEVEANRNNIKSHIKQYGSVATTVYSDAIVEYNGNYVCNFVSSMHYYYADHAVSIVGWDDNYPKENFPSTCRPSKNGAYLVLNSWGTKWGENGYFWMSYEDSQVEYNTIGFTSVEEISENLVASEIIVTDIETGSTLDNGAIPKGTKIKMNVDVQVTNEISGEEIEVKLRDRESDFTSLITVTGDDLVNKKAELEVLFDTSKVKGDQQILEISYGTETVSKMIETPQDFVYKVNADDTITLVEYVGANKVVVISSEYDGYKVSGLGDRIFENSSIERIYLPEGIKTIGNYAFAGMTKLEELNLPSTVTSIGEGTFIACKNLKEIVIPRSVTKIGAGLVQQCSSIEKIVIFKETTTIGDYMFYDTNPAAIIYCEAGSAALTYAQNRSLKYSIITNSYNITYNKNAGADAVSNMPSTQSKVQYERIKISDKKPVRENYNFLGWSISATSTLPEYGSGDFYKIDANLTLYAIWESNTKEVSYKVEYYKDGVKESEKTYTDEIPKDITTIPVNKSDINTTDKYLGYEFEKTEPTIIPSAIEIDGIIKVYYKVINYEIAYDLQGGTLPEGKSNSTTYTVNDEVSISFEPSKEGHTFTGWTGSNGATAQKVVTIASGSTGNKSYKANYSVNSYKITVEYVYNGQEEPFERSVQTVEYGKDYSIESPKISGYTPSIKTVSGTMGARDITIKVIYSENDNTPYKVEHYKQNIENNEYTLFETEELEGKTNESTAAVAKNYPGFTVKEFSQANISGDESTVIKIYYDRNEYSITVKYVYEDGSKAADDVIKTYKYEAFYSIMTPPILGYTPTIQNVIGNKSTENETVTVIYKANTDTPYIVYHLKQNIENDDYTMYESEYLRGTTGTDTAVEAKNYPGFTVKEFSQVKISGDVAQPTVVNVYYDRNIYTLTYKVDGIQHGEVESYKFEAPVTARENPTKSGYKFSGWSNLPEKMPANNVEVTGTFSLDNTQTKQISYKIQYYVQNSLRDEDIIRENVQLLEEKVLVDKPRINPNKYPGYDFVKTEPEIVPDYIGDGEIIKVYYADEILPVINASVNGTEIYNGDVFEENNEVQLELRGYDNNASWFEVTIKKDLEIYEGTNVQLFNNLGYYSKTLTEEGIYEVKATFSDIHGSKSETTFTIKLDYIDYTITYDLDDGILEEGITNPEIFTIKDSFTLKNPSKKGHTFIGWTGSNGTVPQKEVKIEKGTEGNKEYKANYTVNTYTKIVEYVYEDGSMACDSKYQTVEYGKNYKIESPEIPGYTPSQVEVLGIMDDKDETITITYFANTNTPYKVEHYKQNLENNEYELVDTENLIGTTKTQTNAIAREYIGFVSKEFSQEVIKENGSTVVKIYYDRISHTVTYKIDDEIYGEVETYKFGQKIIQRENPTKLGYSFSGWSEIPEIMLLEDIAIEGSFVLDETQAKEIGYTIEYYKVNEKVDSDTMEIKQKVHVLEPDELTVDKSQINITDKYEGYKFERTEPEIIPDTIENGGIIKVFYREEMYNYTVKYYYDGIEDEEKREIKEARKGQIIEVYTQKLKEGYELQRVENSTLKITDNPENNVISVYYVRKTGKVIVEYRDFITGEEVSSKIIKYGKVFDKYDVSNAKAEFTGYILMEEPKVLSGEFAEDDVVKVFKYAKKSKVIINYIDKNSEEMIQDPSVIEGYETKEYETKESKIEGYTFVETTGNTKGTMTRESIKVIYYYIKNTTVKVEYIDKTSGNKISEDRIVEGHEGDLYKVEPKQIDGYKLLEETENAEGTMAHDKIVVKFYYEKIKVETPEEDKKDEGKEEQKPQDETITSEDYTIKKEKITKIASETDISNFKKHISSKEKITIYNADGKEAKEDEIIKTGMKLKSENGKEYDLIVRGDISCDGKVSLVDLSKLILHYNEKKGFILSGCPNSAADMNGDGKVSLVDVSQMLVLYNSK